MTAAGKPAGLKAPVPEQPKVAVGDRAIGMDLRGEEDNPVVDPFQAYGHFAFRSNLSQEVLNAGLSKPRTLDPDGVG